MTIWTKLLIYLGFRCLCGGKYAQVYGWNKLECMQCGKIVKT